MKKLRQKRGLTVQALAKQIGVSHVSVLYWEKGERIPNAKFIPKIAEALNVSVKEVLEGLKIS